ncbi:septum site-determining protein MinC [Lederbergia lenta]|uniref:Probable septum site-determining protein MinC n=1 Tax=Lederbergia lenta TaxID=1467 RepID=A0A2X4WDW6_LEDLE|nr:septum site-determining protein MinC [Lederbergia lenta]MCM3111275.1 septum site-determining protein MinC [Lederbergia lenta]MEC2325337.1 septum site-determining protein MinC [Lederbergia lenta]SQI55800.1 septum site-determining protein MinC [Lederbergia lenta]
MKNRQYVMIKGTKSGLSLQLDDRCSYEDLVIELEDKLADLQGVDSEGPLISVRIQSGNRYLDTEQQEELKELIRQKHYLIVEDIESNVMTKNEAYQFIDEQDITSVSTIVRSGQVLEVVGDLLLVGDVNPGGTVKAGGNIFIMGALKGVAHAGFTGKKESVIVASFMTPSQLRIFDSISRAPDHYEHEDQHHMECAYIDKNDQIVIDRLQVLKHIRPDITRFKGGHYYG